MTFKNGAILVNGNCTLIAQNVNVSILGKIIPVRSTFSILMREHKNTTVFKKEKDLGGIFDTSSTFDLC